MNILHKFTRRSLSLNKSRTAITIIGIVLSMALFTAVIEAVYSGLQYLIRAETERTGAFHAIYYDVSEDEVEQIIADKNVNKMATWQEVGWAKISQDSRKPYLLIQTMSENITDMLSIDIITGRLPQNSNEIILPEELIAQGNFSFNIGDELTLSVGDRMVNGYKLNLHNPFSDDESESIANATESIYTVVGIYAQLESVFDDYYNSSAFFALTCGAGKGDYTVFFTVKHPSSFYSYMSKNAVNSNWQSHAELLRFSGSFRNNNISRVFYGFAAILIFLISFGSIALIYNSFAISVSERTKQFGILKSVGATKKQIRSSVIYETLFLSAIAIPIGMIIGCLGIGITLWGLEDAFSSILGFSGNTKIYLVISPVGLIIAACICLITVLISALLPAKKAVRTSAIDSIRQSNDVKIRKRDIRIFPLTKLLFKFEGMLAAKNFKRNKKRYRATIVSLFLSITLFISASSFCSYLTDSVGGISSAYGHSDTDITYSDYGTTPSPEELLSLLSTADNLKKSAYAQSLYISLNFDTSKLSSSYRALPNAVLSDSSESDTKIRSHVVFADNKSFESICKENGINPERYYNTAAPIALAYNKVVSSQADSQYNTKWIETNVFKKGLSNISGYATDIKIIENYTCVEIEPDDDGNNLYYYYSNEYLSELRKSDQVQNPDKSKAIILTANEAETRMTVFSDTFIEDLPFWLIAGSETVFIYPIDIFEALTSGTIFADMTGSVKFYFDSGNCKATYNSLKSLLSGNGLPVSTLYDLYSEYESAHMLVTIVNVFAYGFIILISLIALANVFNTISTSIFLRRREFAILRSVGMTNQKFSKMMNYECIIYGLKSLLWGLPAAFALTYVIYRITGTAYETDFYVPWHSVVIAVGSVFVVVFATMLYATRKIRHDNTIDALRNENL